MVALIKVMTNFGAIKTKKKEIDMARTMKTIDGNAAAAHVAYAFSDNAMIYGDCRKRSMDAVRTALENFE